MHANFVAHQFELNHQVAHAVLTGITHQESLVHPQPAGNCLNWVLGHMVATRNMLMYILGEPHILSDLEAQPYQRGTRPPLHADQAMLLPEIVAALDRSQQTLMRRLAELPDQHIQAAAGFSFHESYHLGQCGLLRRLLGKAGAIA